MKKIIFSALALLVSLFSVAQETDQRNFDYQQTKHEFSLDLLPVIQGSNPVNLLYRKHYISKKGNDVGLRLGLQVGSSLAIGYTSDNQSNDMNIKSHNYHLSIGKERQIPMSKNILSYYGVDFGTRYSSFKSTPATDDPDVTPFQSTHSTFDFSSTGFLGVRYHLSPWFSIGAETALSLYYNFSSTTRTFTYPQDISTTKQTYDNLGLRMDPVRSIRFAYHF